MKKSLLEGEKESLPVIKIYEIAVVMVSEVKL